MSDCEHKNTDKLSPEITRCLDCRQVSVGGRWAPMSLPVKACCEECQERTRKLADGWNRKKRCAGCRDRG